MLPLLADLGGLPAGAAGAWSPAAQAAALGLLTLVQEDAPLVAAASFAAMGRFSWGAAFLACFLGIWGGDALLHLAARVFGRRAMQHRWVSRWIRPEALARSETWFLARGPWLLVTSRFIPGLRLPTYVASGLVGYPLRRFLLVTGVTVAFWTAAVLLAAGRLGAELTRVSGRTLSPWVLAAAALGLLYLIRRMVERTRAGAWRRLSTAIQRWTRWEFWPAWLFYPPIVAQWLRLSLKHGSLTLPSAANPGIAHGGLIGESKFGMLDQLHGVAPEATAEAFLLPAGAPERRQPLLDALLASGRLSFPFVLKPDLGERGKGVRIIRSAEQAAAYLRETDLAMVAQEYAPGPYEAGVWYHRSPNEPHGRIFSLVEKVFPELTGDGVHTVEELIWRDPRARFMAAKYLSRLGSRRGEIPARGEVLPLVQAGNHAQGAIFREGARLITPELTARLDAIAHGLEGFHVGRFDLRYTDEAAFRAGRGFKIVELNGAAAEAGSVYDERTRLLDAYRTLFRQWEIVFEIAATNRDSGARVTPPGELFRVWRDTKRALDHLPVSD